MPGRQRPDLHSNGCTYKHGGIRRKPYSHTHPAAVRHSTTNAEPNAHTEPHSYINSVAYTTPYIRLYPSGRVGGSYACRHWPGANATGRWDHIS